MESPQTENQAERSAGSTEISKPIESESERQDPIPSQPTPGTQATYASVTAPVNRTLPIFFKERDFFGNRKPSREEWFSHTELYKIIGQVVKADRIGGLQRVGGLWRIYMDNAQDRATLLTKGLHIRGQSIELYSLNPYRLDTNYDDTVRVRVKNIPLSADDGQIARALTARGCQLVGNISREKLRVDGRLTNCDTGDRFAIVQKPLITPLPRMMDIGRYRAKIFHSGQQSDIVRDMKCAKCLETGHGIRECTNDWKCRGCMLSGHRQFECPQSLDSTSEIQVPRGDPQSTADDMPSGDTRPGHQCVNSDELSADEQATTTEQSDDGMTTAQCRQKTLDAYMVREQSPRRSHKSRSRTQRRSDTRIQRSRRSRSPPTPLQHDRVKKTKDVRDMQDRKVYEESTDSETY